MALRGGPGILQVSALILCMIPATSNVMNSSRSTAGGKRVSNPTDSLLAEPQLIGRVGYSAAGLTYVPSDMGPDMAILPDPALYLSGAGLYVIDRGTDSASWRLIRMDPDGKVRYSENLAEKLNLKKPRELVPVAIHADSKGNLNLVGSRKFDFAKQRQEQFFSAAFSPEGKLIGSWELPEFRYDGNLLFLNDGNLANLEKSGAAAHWVLYSEKQERRSLGAAGTNRNAVRIGKQILELTSGNSLAALAEDGAKTKLRLRGPALQGEPVAGDCFIFGAISLSAIEAGKNPQEFLQARTLQLLFFDVESATLCNVGSAALRPNLTATESTKFAIQRTRQSCFDAQGNLFEIAWGPSSLEIYRYALNRSRFDSLLRSLKQSVD